MIIYIEPKFETKRSVFSNQLFYNINANGELYKNVYTSWRDLFVRKQLRLVNARFIIFSWKMQLAWRVIKLKV